MRKHIEKLNAISKKEKRRIIGLMSGTSLDGLDIAVCSLIGNGRETSFHLEQFKTVAYNEEFRKGILEVFSKKDTNLEKVVLLNKSIANRHAYMINQCLAEWHIPAGDIDLIASHGQTIYHAPKHLHGDEAGHATLQLGDGDHMAVATGIITISDFRQKHIAGGGEGAPLAAYGDLILFSDKEKNVILLNIGGIANFSFLPAQDAGKEMFSTDCGPGNTLMDAWMQLHYTGHNYDKDASIALRGRVNENLLLALMGDPFFKLPFPKSTGPELFSLDYLRTAQAQSDTLNLSPDDVMATLNRFTAMVICESLRTLKTKEQETSIYVSGGGMHNPGVMAYLHEHLPGVTLQSTEEKKIDPDAKEAILFALLANECVAGRPETFEHYFPALSMGKISFPG